MFLIINMHLYPVNFSSPWFKLSTALQPKLFSDKFLFMKMKTSYKFETLTDSLKRKRNAHIYFITCPKICRKNNFSK